MMDSAIHSRIAAGRPFRASAERNGTLMTDANATSVLRLIEDIADGLGI